MSYGTPFHTAEPTYAGSGCDWQQNFEVSYRGNADVQTEQQRDDEFQAILDFMTTYPGFVGASSYKQYTDRQTVTPTP